MPSSAAAGKLEGKVTIVTGGSSGIGRAISLRFAGDGAIVVVADVNEQPLEGGEPTAQLIESRGEVGRYLRTDVSAAGDAQAVVDFAVGEFGKLDVVVNNAAIYRSKPLLETSEQDWDDVFAVNLKGVFLLCRSAVRQMLTQEAVDGVRGRLVNISSQHGMIAAPGDISYGTSKAGVVYITRQIACDYSAQGIICNAVAPGKIRTGSSPSEDDAARVAGALARIPLRRLGSPADIARTVAFLASDEASYVAGANWLVDGGWMSS
jgi:NAD(P)-dependent dehydrogenase (short-subunit alcohol dehydrogenase family)